ncbi:MAG: acylneuraminate cytidylyltransferase family protein [Candidatus Peribacteraceae bacterium]|nr:acylneuraminate cytidylyltransferase family protein [Candidatus Peribacteraceae bacterium]
MRFCTELRYYCLIVKIIAIIPARSGSKAIPHKNIQLFAGKPLMAHSIEQALRSKLIERVIVSTDSQEYAAIAREAGAEVPFLRPAELSTDHSTDLEAFTHALTWLQEHEGAAPDICVHLRPTHPNRRVADIDAAIQVLLDHPEFDSVRSVAPARQTPFKMWMMQDDHAIIPAIQSGLKDAYNLPRQMLPKAYVQNACIDVVRSAVILQKGSMTGDRIYGYAMEEDFDIDTPDELKRAEQALLAARIQQPIQPGETRTFCFDIDGVIAGLVSGNDYALSQPQQEMVALIQHLHSEGHRIILHTARGSMTGKDWREVTERQLKEWGVPYEELHFGKPAADVYVDDRAWNPVASVSPLSQ